jgi:flavin-dependent dehydrogenase
MTLVMKNFKKGTIPARTDVVVVGAGPAGIAAASKLVESGARVVLIDRHQRPGGKACGGGLTREAWSAANFDPLSVPDWGQVFSKLKVQTEVGGVVLEDGEPLLATIDRQAWAMENLESLLEAGVDVFLGKRLLGFRGDRAFIDNNELKFNFLVAADGASSRVRRLLGIGTGLVVRAWQIRIPTAKLAASPIDLMAPKVWFNRKLLGAGYAWSFPCNDEIRVGCGASSRISTTYDLKRSFVRLLRDLGLDREGGTVQAGTIGCNYIGHRFGRIYLAGDAAGLASPLTGEGIGQALISGREVALEIAQRDYRSATIPRLGVRHRRTHDVLSNGRFSVACTIAPLLLRVPALRKETIARYIT